MSNQITGAPKVSVNVDTVGAIIARSIEGRVLCQAITEKGLPNTPIQISNESEMLQYFGRATTPSAKEVLRMVRKGVTVILSRVSHYTSVLDTGTLQGTKATASIGTTGVEIDFAAKSVGAGYNGITIAIEAPKSGGNGVVDIVVTVAGFTPYRKNDVVAVLSAESVAALNQELPDIDIVDTTGTLTIASGTLTGGAETVADIVATDIIGSSTNNTGIYAFDKADSSIMRMANTISQTNAVDVAYVAYATNTDRTVHLATPVGLSYQNALDYRNAEATYSSGSKINSSNARLVAGSVKIPDPYNVSQTIESTGIADVMVARAKVDSLKGVFQSAMQQPFNLFTDVRGVVTAFSSAQKDTLANSGLLWLENTNGQPQLNNDNTLLTDQTSTLKSENISDLVLFIKRYMILLAAKYKGKPNTPQDVWRPIYREAKVFLQDLADRRAFVGSEGVGYLWTGDQFAETAAQAVYNSQSDINQQIFKVQLKIKPVAATKYIVINLAVYQGDLAITEEA